MQTVFQANIASLVHYQLWRAGPAFKKKIASSFSEVILRTVAWLSPKVLADLI